ncbi:metallophosphoesterase [uncultured Dokdonia sp.]|uniref:metallophosphoesterase n=1 Tax=uncultured Dokdonia sp. TaxID=575653 RepID=UPI00260237EB|nr:metallophosphoesterase [uncultured Dokdonia sp.]
MRILHLTDLHYKNKGKYFEDSIRIVEALIKSISKYENKVDIVIFSGDLVWSGEIFNDFEEAEAFFITPICEALNIDKVNFFICPGNHDVYRGVELDDISDSILKLQNNDDLDKYVVKNEKRSLEESLLNLTHYFKFQKQFFKNHFSDYGDTESDSLYTIHEREIDSKSIGIVSMNSAWRANNSDTDSGNLLFPISHIKRASRQIRDCDVKILILHHPLSDFKYWNKLELEDVIYKDFHLMFSGHVHSNRDSLHATSDIGIYHSTSSASLSYGNEEIGFTLLKVNSEDFSLKIKNAIYSRPEGEFYFGDRKNIQIPISKEKELQNKFRKTIRKRFAEKSDEANKLFISYREITVENNFLSLFTTPIVKLQSQSHPKPTKTKNLLIADLVSNKDENQILFGRDKSGKSSIIYKLCLDILNQFNELQMLPVLVNCGNYIKSNKTINVIELLSDFYEVNRKTAERLSKQYHIKILLDDFKGNEPFIVTPLSKYINRHNNVSVVAVANETMFASFTGGLIGEITFVNRYIYDITRTEIRQLTHKWPNIPKNKKEVVLEKINTLFSQLNIPSNYWTVSLFIWIFEKNVDVNIGNNFQLIDLYVDNLLDKDNFILSKQYKIDFNDLKDFLSDLAFHLVKNHTGTSYLLSYVELINYIDSYKKANKKFVIETEEILELILDKGIIKKSFDAKYTFRLNGVFEYFLGYFMAYNKKFRNEIIKDGHFYLSFRNEFEVCAGLIPQDAKFVKKIFKKTKEIYNETNSNLEKTDLDQLLVSKVSEVYGLNSQINEILKSTLSESLDDDDKDSIMESLSPSNNRLSDVNLKKYYATIESTSDNLEDALFILGRVFRNSKLKNQDKLNEEIFDFILNSTCTYSLQLIEDIRLQNFNEVDDDISEEKLIKLLTQFMPMVAQVFFYDIAIQSNLEIILKENIEKLKKNKNGNELKLLILYFSLIDLDLKDNVHLIEEVIDLISIPVLKQTTVFKLYIYLSFKCGSNKNLKDKIGKFIKMQELTIDSSQNIGEIEKRIKAIEKGSSKK